MDQNQKRDVATKAIQLFLKNPELADELSAARETLCHLRDNGDDRALDLAEHRQPDALAERQIDL